jgi:hypothetical protein
MLVSDMASHTVTALNVENLHMYPSICYIASKDQSFGYKGTDSQRSLLPPRDGDMTDPMQHQYTPTLPQSLKSLLIQEP